MEEGLRDRFGNEMRKRFFVLVFLTLPVMAAPPDIGGVATGVRFPSFNEKGQMTSVILGDTARVMPNGYVEITNLRMDFLDPNSSEAKVQMHVESPHCLYHRERGAAASDKDVRITSDRMTVTGTGFVWENQSQVLKILSNSKVVLRGGKEQLSEGIKP